MTDTTMLHPDCRIAWDRGLTNYPTGEHARDCEKCQQWQRDQETKTMQETKHNITGEMRREFFGGETKKTVEALMDERLKQLPQERLVRRVKIGRNSPCPCGSGHKFKRCCIAGLRRS